MPTTNNRITRKTGAVESTRSEIENSIRVRLLKPGMNSSASARPKPKRDQCQQYRFCQKLRCQLGSQTTGHFAQTNFAGTGE